MDEFLTNALSRWVINQFGTDDRAFDLFTAMYAEMACDPEFWSQRGFWPLYDKVSPQLAA